MTGSRVCLAGLIAVAIMLTAGAVGARVQAKGFTYYPKENAVVEAATDKGLMVELIVRCPAGVGIVTYSKVERLYCGPDHQCVGSLSNAVNRLCR